MRTSLGRACLMRARYGGQEAAGLAGGGATRRALLLGCGIAPRRGRGNRVRR
jgi:hypothetical protein